jgi:hypothetical protein
MQVVDKRFGKKHFRPEFALFSEFFLFRAWLATQVRGGVGGGGVGGGGVEQLGGIPTLWLQSLITTNAKFTPEFGPSSVVLAGDQGAHVGECGPGWTARCPVACLVWSPPLMQPRSWEFRPDQTFSP